MEPENESKSGGEQNQGKHDSGTASNSRTGSDCSEYGNQPIGTGEPDRQRDDSASSHSSQPGSEAYGKSLRLLIESVRGQKAVLKMQMQMLDEQERQIEKVLTEYEESIRGTTD